MFFIAGGGVGGGGSWGLKDWDLIGLLKLSRAFEKLSAFAAVHLTPSSTQWAVPLRRGAGNSKGPLVTQVTGGSSFRDKVSKRLIPIIL